MILKKKFKILGRTMARFALKFAYGLLKRFPQQWVSGLLLAIISTGFRFSNRHRSVARESLGIAFGGTKTAEEIEAIIEHCFQNLSQGIVEAILYDEHFEMMKNTVAFVGKEHLDAALAQGKGVIALSAHFGNFPMMMMHMTRIGYPTNVVMRRTRDPKIDEFFAKKRDLAGMKTIYTMPRKNAVVDTLKALRNQEIVFILMDQNFGSEGAVFVDFFGRPAATAPGPIVFAHRSGAPIVPMFIRRDTDGINKIEIFPEMPLEKHDDYDEMIRINVAKATKIIENHIRKYPYEWGWMHRRWKTPTPEEAATGETHGER